MQNTKYNILVWLPTPMGDAILCTPALRAIRRHFESQQITFFANHIVREVLSPNPFNDAWLEQQSGNPLPTASLLRQHHFTHVFLFKNSFASALAAYLARIPNRIGYAREGRGFMLTAGLYPQKLSKTRFKPVSMVDYYLLLVTFSTLAEPSHNTDSIAGSLDDKTLTLHVAEQDMHTLQSKVPQVVNPSGPLVVLVPGGAFGPSKCWPTDRFAETADWMITNYNATVIVSVSSDPAEKQIAKDICDSSEHTLINLAQTRVSLGELKALFSIADLIITNDTGPRHIAIALRRKLITLFGPNDPAWTDTGYENEIKLIGQAPCAPCRKPICSKSEHLCMQSISVETLCNAAKKLLAPAR